MNPSRPEEFSIHIRIPGWSRNQPVPSDLYRYITQSEEKVTLKVNNEVVSLNLEKGFAHIQRNWETGDTIEPAYGNSPGGKPSGGEGKY